jgi:hypothetical protein
LAVGGYSASEYRILEQAAELLGKSSVNQLLACAHGAPESAALQVPTPEKKDIDEMKQVDEDDDIVELENPSLPHSPPEAAECEANHAANSGFVFAANLDDWVDASETTGKGPSFMADLTEGVDPASWADEASIGNDSMTLESLDALLPSAASIATTSLNSVEIPRVPESKQTGTDLNVVLWTPGAKLQRPHIRNPRSSARAKDNGLKVVPWDPSKEMSKKQQSNPLPQPKRTPQDPQRRMETTTTRKSKACIRCRMQRTRVWRHSTVSRQPSAKHRRSVYQIQRLQMDRASHAHPSLSVKYIHSHVSGTKLRSVLYTVRERPEV